MSIALDEKKVLYLSIVQNDLLVSFVVGVHGSMIIRLNKEIITRQRRHRQNYDTFDDNLHVEDAASAYQNQSYIRSARWLITTIFHMHC